MTGITLLGLGPGDPKLLTREAWSTLNEIKEIYLRTRQHPTVQGFPPDLVVHDFDSVYEEEPDFDQVYQRIVSSVLELGKRQEGVVYAVPGCPFIGETTSIEIIRICNEQNIPVKIVNGMSFLSPAFAALNLDPLPKMVIVDALELVSRKMPDFPPDMPVIISQIHSRWVAGELKLTLMSVYPEEYPVAMIHAAGTQNECVENIALYQIDQSTKIGLLTLVYLPPLGQNTSFEGFQDLLARLRSPEGCPWDREQTHLTLRPHLIEETYECLAALDKEDDQALKEELGDLLLQIVLHTQIAEEMGEFKMADVIHGISSKLIRRHPHVFDGLKVTGTNDVIRNWERIKSKERHEGSLDGNGVLEGVPSAMPALSQADAYQKRVERVGFDWENIHGVYQKIDEEIHEVKTSAEPESIFQEIGDLLFSVVNLARWYHVDAESALRSTNIKFKSRFLEMEKLAAEKGLSLMDISIKEWDEMWEIVKNNPATEK